MSSDGLRLFIRSDRDVQLTLYDAVGLKQAKETEQIDVAVPRGLYRVHLDRCGFASEHLIQHDAPGDLEFAGPLVESPAPIEIARDAAGHAASAQQLSIEADDSAEPRDPGGRARLFIFVRRTKSDPPGVQVPSEALSIHDLTGRRVWQLTHDGSGSGQHRGAGWFALSRWVSPGTYRIRVGRTRRDFAVTIPAGRAAHVFLADHRAISLRTARVYLPQLDEPFDPRGPIARATESVLWALGRPSEELPAIARDLLDTASRDLAFGIACAHLARRQRDRAAFERLMDLLREHGRGVPDVAILQHRCEAQPSETPPALAVPPMLRASLVLAIENQIPVALPSAFAEVARTSHDDSVWCTWSPRWWDERWIEPTIERLRSPPEGPSRSLSELAGVTRLPVEVVERALDRLDADSTRGDGKPRAMDPQAIPGVTLGVVIGRGARSTVYRARGDDGVEVAVKLMPVGREDTPRRVIDDLAHIHSHGHRRLLEFRRAGTVLENTMLWVEMELCRESLFDRVATLGRPLSVDEACHFVLQAVEALQYLHDQGVVHGHIHPGSLLIRTDGDLALGLPGLAVTSSGAGAVVAADADAVRFMAPEVVLDRDRATAASDVWSLAATLYFLLTLELPRERYTDQTEPEAARQGLVVPITDHLAGLSQPLIACFERALSAQPDSRFRDGKELCEALRQAVLGSVLAWRADRLYGELVAGDPMYEATVRTLVFRLTERSGDRLQRRRVPQSELTYRDRTENRRVQDVLRRFEAAELTARIPRSIGDARTVDLVELAHDQVLRWHRIRRWLDELDAEPEARSLLTAVGDAAQAWETGRRMRQYLWNDQRVALACMLARRHRFLNNELEDEFVRRSRRLRGIWHFGLPASLMAMLAATVVITGCVYLQRGAAINKAVAARQDLAHSLEEAGRRHILDGYPLRALPCLVEAGRLGETGPSLQMLVHAAMRGLPLTPQLQHDSEVKRASFSPDGSRVVTATSDGSAYVWDAATGGLIAELGPGVGGARGAGSRETAARAHDGVVVAAVFSRDGKWIVTASEDWTARIWDAQTGRSHAGVLEHHGIVESAAFSPDGKHVVTASVDHSARIWNVNDGKLELRLDHDDAVWSAVFSPDGRHVLTASSDGTARIWNAETGALEHELRHEGIVWSAVFSADGARVVTASQDATARIWDARTGTVVEIENPATRKGPRRLITLSLSHRDAVTSARFDASGAYVVTTSDNTARVWNAVDGTPVSPWLEHQGRVTSAVFSPDGTRLVTASSDHAARMWDSATGGLIRPIFEHLGAVTSAAFSPDGGRVITTSADRTAQIWAARAGRPPVRLAFARPVRYASFSPDGARVVTASGDDVARIWDTATGKLDRKLAQAAPTQGAMVSMTAFSFDGKQVATASVDRTARIWDATNGRMLVGPISLPGVTRGLGFSPEGSRLITASESDALHWDSTLQIWDAATGSPVALTLEYASNVVNASLSRDRSLLLALDQTGMVRVWDAATGKRVPAPLVNGPGPRSIEDRPGETPLESAREITQAAFSPDGRRVVTASADRTARIWNAMTGERSVPPLEHDARVVSAAFSPDGARIVTVSGDRTARVWDAATGQPLTPLLINDEPIVSAAFSADGERLLTADGHSVRTWDVSLDRRSLQDWSNVAEKSPYVIKDGVLMLRSIAASAALATPGRVRPPSS